MEVYSPLVRAPLDHFETLVELVIKDRNEGEMGTPLLLSGIPHLILANTTSTRYIKNPSLHDTALFPPTLAAFNGNVREGADDIPRANQMG